MEKSKVIATTYEILELLKQDELVRQTKQLENELMSNVKIVPLIAAFQKAEERLNNAIRFNSENRRLYEKELSLAKEKLYQTSEVKQYFEMVDKTQDFLNEIAMQLFNGLIEEIRIKPNLKKK